MSSHRLFPLLLTTLGLALGCNTYIQNPGPYELTAIEKMRDDCGLLVKDEDLWDASLLITGQVVRMDFELMDMQLVGRFLSGADRFAVDGSVANTTVLINGQECLLDQISVHLEGSTVCDTRFDGTLRVRYEARRPDSCVCELRARFEALQDGKACEDEP